jgi:uncharacterized protein (DUF924 family)
MTGGAESGAAAIGSADVLAFWRAAGPDQWFEKNAAFDLEIRRRFCSLWHAARAGELAKWEETPEDALARSLRAHPSGTLKLNPRGEEY